MTTRPWFSLIVPTRARPVQLQRFLESVARTAACPKKIEIVLVMDEDDRTGASVACEGLKVVRVIGRAGRRMGALNAAGFEASRGRYVMLLNDDVVIRSRRWDAKIHKWFGRYPDNVLLVHVNDTLLRDNLCTFPLLSRVYCALIGGIAPPSSERYAIDDHIED